LGEEVCCTLSFNFLSSACDSYGAAVSFDSECELSSTTWVSTGSEVGVKMNLRSGMEMDDIGGLLFEVLIAFFLIFRLSFVLTSE
jgi:hypothetical protein